MLAFQTFSFASTPISSANLVTVQEGEYHLQYDKNGTWSYNITTYVGYSMNGKIYPAYCLDVDRPGVNEVGDYTVNIDSVIDREDVWRVIVNGFPYKSASELGQANDLDAFVVTKQAVYCLLYNWDPDTHFRHDGPDSRGIAIANKISELVAIGRSGGQTRQNASLSVNKSGGFQASGNYYYQDYSVSSNVGMSSYSITSLLNAPSGTFTADLSGNPKTTFGNGENFRVYVPTSSLTSDLDITILLTSKCETYPVFYGSAPNSDWQDYAVTFDPLEDIGGQTNLQVTANNAKIVINKTDKENGAKIEGVTFNLLNSSGQVISTKATNSNGIVEFTGLYAGTYTLKETSTNSNYILDTSTKSVTVGFSETKTISWTNEYKKGNIKVIKVDKDNNEIRVPNCKFELYKNGTKIGNYITDSNGEIYISNLRIGEYKLKEVESAKFYRLDNTEHTINVSWSQVQAYTGITIQNEKQKGQIQVEKVDQDYNSIKISGVVFDVLTEDGKKVEQITTDENGKAITSMLPIDISYKLVEVKTQETYILDTTERVVTLTQDNEIYNLQVGNKKKTGNIKVYKVDSENHKVVLGSVQFDLYSEEFDKIIGTYVTDVNGEITIKNLRVGNYTLIEKTTNKWYNLADDTEVEVKWNKTTDTIIYNTLKKGQIKIIKVDKDNNEVKLAGVKFNVLDEDGNLLETIITDENGEAVTKEYPVREFEKLILQEIETLKEYKLNDEMQTIELQANEIVNITFENEVKKGKIKIIKVDKDNHEVKLEGVTFEVLDENGNIVQTLITDKSGECETDFLPISIKYRVREVQTKEEYVLNDEMITIKLEQDQIKTLTFENEIKKGQIKVIKTDGETTYPLKDVEFEIYDSKGNLVDTIKTNEKGEAISKRLSIYDEYKIIETKTRKGYILNTKEVTNIELKENEISNIKFENYKGKGTLKIVKTSSDGKVEGFRFLVKGTTYTGEEYEQEFITNEEGLIIVEGLLEGKYTITEIRDELACNYEELDPQEIEIKNGETSTAEFYNKLIEIPDTSDDSINLGWILIGLVIIFLGLVYIAFLIRKYKREIS